MRATIVCAALLAVVLPFASAQVSGNELANIDYTSMLGGPLNAAVNAQAQAALASVNFIKNIGFDKNNRTINVQFGYSSVNATTGATVKNSLSVPLLTLMPIPYLRIEEITISFNAKIQSTTLTSTTSNVASSAAYSDRWNWWIYSGGFSCSYSNQEAKKNTNNEEREFSMSVELKAVQDDMPPGMARVLDILEEAIALAQAA